MLDVEVPEGAIYYGKIRQRHDVMFDDNLRSQTIDAAYRVRRLIESGQTPKPVCRAKCSNCSLIHICLPRTVSRNKSAKKYLLNIIHEL
jgi:CRISPR-associated exonuclease Cas4